MLGKRSPCNCWMAHLALRDGVTLDLIRGPCFVSHGCRIKSGMTRFLVRHDKAKDKLQLNTPLTSLV